MKILLRPSLTLFIMGKHKLFNMLLLLLVGTTMILTACGGGAPSGSTKPEQKDAPIEGSIYNGEVLKRTGATDTQLCFDGGTFIICNDGPVGKKILMIVATKGTAGGSSTLPEGSYLPFQNTSNGVWWLAQNFKGHLHIWMAPSGYSPEMSGG